MDSYTLTIVAITVAVCALIAVGAWFALNQMRSRRLKEHFGPEYDHVVERARDRNLAEAELEKREHRVKKYRIIALSKDDQAHYERAWTDVQGRFVDDPAAAIKEADELIFEVMEKRGYPVSGFDQAADDLSVDYPLIVSNYREATAIAQRNRRGQADTEALRQGLVHYRALFHQLLEAQSGKQPQAELERQRTPSGLSYLNKFKKKPSRGGLRP